MSASILIVLLLGVALAYVNGANDVSKGIATLVGSGVTNYRRAIAWGALWTAAGGLLGAAAAKAMVATFGHGLLAAGTSPTLAAATATLIGAAAWVLIATRTGLPVSTTHAIVGSLSGVAAVAYGLAGVHWGALGGKIVIPLLVSPVVSLGAVVLLLRGTNRGTRSSARARGADCLCAEVQPVITARELQSVGVATLTSALHLTVVTDTREACAVEYPRALRVTLDHLHWLTSGATSFARGLNDAPKIVALVLSAAVLQGPGAVPPAPFLFALVTVGMVAGSLVAGRRVTQVLAERVTPLDHREGFIANVVTASLVTAGATLGLPMSTTHVASGGIVGAGAERSSLNRRTLRDIAMAWVVTLPASALLGIAAYAIAKMVVA